MGEDLIVGGGARIPRGDFPERLIDSCITQTKAQGPSRTCNASQEEEEEECRRRWRARWSSKTFHSKPQSIPQGYGISIPENRIPSTGVSLFQKEESLPQEYLLSRKEKCSERRRPDSRGHRPDSAGDFP